MAVWSAGEHEGVSDMRGWALAMAAVRAMGTQVSECHRASAGVVTWRRDKGEFPLSGTLRSLPDRHVGWLGQCVDDGGDATPAALRCFESGLVTDVGLAGLNGPFAVAVLDADDGGALRVYTDRHRHYPVYLHRSDRVCVLSTDLRCILPWLPERQVDRTAADLFLRCGELIDRLTLVKGVEMLPGGTRWTASSSGITESVYWRMRHDGVGRAAQGPSAQELGKKLRQGVRRMERANSQSVITLSGGLDSRIILDLCEQPEKVSSFTWGQAGCRDIVCAAAYAKTVKSPHTVRHWEPSAFPPLWSAGVLSTGAALGVDSMYMLPYTELLGQSGNVVFNGLAGDVLLGGNFLKRDWLHVRDARPLGALTWRWRVSAAEDAVVDRLQSQAARERPARELWAESIAARCDGHPIDGLNDWLYENRIFRSTNCGTMLLRARVESHSPFFDNDFVDAVTRVSYERKLHHRVYLQVMNAVAPRAASVVWQRTGIAPALGYHANTAAMAFHRVGRYAGRLVGVDPFPGLKVADVGAWMREAWRQSVEDVLFKDVRWCEQCGLDVAAIKALWSEHLGGTHARGRQIANLLTLAIFAKTLDQAA